VLALKNPGIFEAPVLASTADSLSVLLIVFVVGAAVALLIFISFTPAPDKAKVAAVVIYLVASMLSAGVVVVTSMVDTVAETDLRNTAHDEYVESVSDWLEDDFAIRVTDDEALDLVAGGELAVTLGDELKSIQLIPGQGETIQVRVVGGQVLQPTE
jgi:hypothetical protein